MVIIRIVRTPHTALTVRTALIRRTTQVVSKRVRNQSLRIRMPQQLGCDILFIKKQKSITPRFLENEGKIIDVSTHNIGNNRLHVKRRAND